MPFQSFTAVPNRFLDLLLDSMSLGEVKVYLYILRRTVGFQKLRDDISISQFCHGTKKSDGTVLDNGTGMTRSSVIQALKLLELNGVIGCKCHPLKPSRPKTYWSNLQ